MKRSIATAAALAMSAMMPLCAMSLADASGKVGDVANDASAVAEIVKQLDPGDQPAFLGKVNAAIDKMPGPAKEKTDAFVAANEAATRAADKSKTADMIAESFATVPVEVLPALNERYAADLVNRKTDPSRSYTDEEYLNIATNLFASIEKRNEGSDNSAVRDTFAALMLMRASGDTSASPLRDALVSMLPTDESRQLAAEDWIPAALGEGRDKSYEPLLAAADSDSESSGSNGSQPPTEAFSLVGNPVFSGSVLADIAAGSSGGAPSTPFADAAFGNVGSTFPIMEDSGLTRVAHSIDPNSPAYGGYRRGSGFKGSNNAGGGESGGYAYQTTY